MRKTCGIEEKTAETIISASSKKTIVKGAKEGINSVRLSSNDQDILDFMADKGAFSSYVKKLIREEIEREKLIVDKSDPDDVVVKLDQILDLLQNNNIGVVQNDIEATINQLLKLSKFMITKRLAIRFVFKCNKKADNKSSAYRYLNYVGAC